MTINTRSNRRSKRYRRNSTCGLQSGFVNFRFLSPKSADIGGNRLSVDASAIFLNFNYTPSLQRLYRVPDDNILHIHGSAANPTERLILGHGWSPDPNPDPYRFEQIPEDADVRVIEGQRLIDRYFRDTFKPTSQVIESKASFFTRLSSVDRVFVMGHSVSEVDHPYFRVVIAKIDAGRVRWKFSYYGDLDGLRERVKALGLPS